MRRIGGLWLLIVFFPLVASCAHREKPVFGTHSAVASATPSLAPLVAPSLPPASPAPILQPPATPASSATAGTAPVPRVLAAPAEHPTPVAFQPLGSAALWAQPMPARTPRGDLFGFPAFSITTPSPQPQPSHVPMLSTDAMPQIVSVEIPSTVVYGGETIVGHVLASSNVASVEVRVANYGASMDKTAPGDFTLAITVPHLPFFLRNRTYVVHFIARNTRGDAVTQSVPVLVR